MIQKKTLGVSDPGGGSGGGTGRGRVGKIHELLKKSGVCCANSHAILYSIVKPCNIRLKNVGKDCRDLVFPRFPRKRAKFPR